MDLENTFYIMGIVYMALNILLLIGIVVLLFYIKKKVSDVYDQIESKIDDISDFVTSPVHKTVDVIKSLLPGNKRRGTSRK